MVTLERDGNGNEADQEARLGVLAQVTRVFGVLAVVGLFFAVTELGGFGLRQDIFRGVLALVGFGCGIYGLARWGTEAWRLRRRLPR